MAPKRTKLVTVALAAALATVIALGGCSSSGQTAGATATTADTATAGDAGPLTLVLDGSGAALSADSLVVSGAGRVTWISDRPERDAGSVAVGTLVAGWADDGFATTPPNAVVTGTTAAGLPRSIPVVLSSPTLDGATVMFRVTWLEDPAPDRPLALSDASVVIDGTDGGRVVAMMLAEAQAQLAQILQKVTTAQQNVESDWENIGLDIAVAVSLGSDFTNAIDGIQSAQAQLRELADPRPVAIEEVVQSAQQAVTTLQDQIQDVLATLSAAEQAALATAVAVTL